ncbi:DUF3012 domain-containing protein [Vibrio cholerae]|nr:DUF3012 domain-containing protein [Vibrio cholerae]EJL6905711.1 DUF3012 domain-containing protein [Vibrio cholerae]ELL0575682.1 DUF3012 domain-containing protein [Vibrio cholerae]ELT7225187.1 DUF3012 domain-containing protein [Vibrio cholerae]
MPPAFRVNSAPASTTIFATLLSEISLPASTTIFIESKSDWTAKEAGSYAKYCAVRSKAPEFNYSWILTTTQLERYIFNIVAI